jgi:hypothetical protein
LSRQVIGNTRTWAARAADEDSGEISASRVGPQNLQERAPLTLPNGGGQVLGGRRRNGCEEKKQSGDGAVHMLLHIVVMCGVEGERAKNWRPIVMDRRQFRIVLS